MLEIKTASNPGSPVQQIKKQLTLGITGLVMSGRGDLIYISTITKILQKYKEYKIVYQLIVHSAGEFDRLEGVRKIANILIEEKLIKEQIYLGETLAELFENIHNHNPEMRILRDCDKVFSTTDQQRVENVFPETMFWIHVSEFFDVSYLTRKFIVLEELGNFEKHPGTNYNYMIGLNASSQPTAKKSCGFFIEDKNRIIENFDEQARALSKIQDPYLNTILHREVKPSLEKCQLLISKTLIVHGYFTKNFNSMYTLLGAFCNSDYVKKSGKNIFISVNHTIELIELETILNLTEINYQIIEINSTSNEIKTTARFNNEKVITITFLCNYYFTRQDLNHFSEAGDFCFPSGDNTFQDAISRKSLPLFDIPLYKKKFVDHLVRYVHNHIPGLQGIQDFFRVLNHVSINDFEENQDKIFSKLLKKNYNKEVINDSKSEQDYYPRIINILSRLITRSLLEEWSVLCLYFQKNLNAYTLVPMIINDAIRHFSDPPDSLPATPIDSNKAMQEFLRWRSLILLHSAWPMGFPQPLCKEQKKRRHPKSDRPLRRSYLFPYRPRIRWLPGQSFTPQLPRSRVLSSL